MREDKKPGSDGRAQVFSLLTPSLERQKIRPAAAAQDASFSTHLFIYLVPLFNLILFFFLPKDFPVLCCSKIVSLGEYSWAGSTSLGY